MLTLLLFFLSKERLKALEQQKDKDVRSSTYTSNQLEALQVR